MTFAPFNSQSAYLPPEFDIPNDEKLSRELISQRERLTATIINVKENAQYEKRELLSGQQYFSTLSGGAIKTSYGYRLTFDLVAFNGGPIPVGNTTLTLTTTTQPAAISIANAIQGIHGFGAASTIANTYFINDPLVFVRLNVWSSISQQLVITNNAGAPLLQAVWVLEYLKT